ncbi:MAG: hypothetical protein ABW222_13495, partial [Actinomycetota bacterium]
MPGGTITVQVDSYGQLKAVAQRVLCWAAADKGKIQINTGTSVPSVVIPEAVISGKGALNLKRGGADLVSGYVASSNPVFAYGNALLPMETDVNTCPSSAAQPNSTSIVTGVGGVP